MVKLLQAIAGGPHGGAELFFTRLAIGLEEAGQQQMIVMRKDNELNILARKLWEVEV